MRVKTACLLAGLQMSALVAFGASQGAVPVVYELLLPAPQRLEVCGGDNVVDPGLLARSDTQFDTLPDVPQDVADQAYAIEITKDGARVVAGGEAGARFARATLAQIAALSGGRPIPCAKIVDWPRLKWRGFMNDCGKNFLEVKGIKAILDVMAAYKMNLFHWHLTDYQGWRLESKLYPQLQKWESFARQVGKFYTQDEFRDVVAYASERGITVMPELDVPGHTLAFRKAMGIDSMSADGTDKVVFDLFAELCSLADAETMPFVHLGTDEARLSSEMCNSDWPGLWARAVNRLGRKAVVWAPGIRMPRGCDCIEMAWHDSYVTNAICPVIDASRMYHASWDPFDVLSHVAFTRPCRWADAKTPQLGAVTCCWHDDNIGDDTMKRFRECMMLPAIVGFAENYWTGRVEDRPEFIKRLPSPGTPAFAMAEALERRIVAQRDKIIAKRWPDLPFQFVGQTQMRWSVRDGESGKLLATDVPQATVWAFNDRAKDNALIGEPCGNVVFETWIKCPDDRTVGCWIDCLKVNGEYGRDGVVRMPGRGEWSAEGAKVLVNGEAVAPPDWKQPGLAAKEAIDVLDRDVPYMNDLLETPFVDEMFTLRPPVPVRFHRGWNHVAVRLPKKESRIRAVTGMTFCPIEGTSEHPREVADLEYSSTPPLHAFVQLWGNNLVREKGAGTSFRDIPVSEGHFYHVRTKPETDGVCRLLNKEGNALDHVRLSEKDAFYPPAGATAAELMLDKSAEVRFYEDPEPPVPPKPDPNAVAYEDRPHGLPTDQWQKEIDAVASSGGGTVRVPEGVWHVKPFILRSNVTLELSEGAVLLASVNPDDYDPDPVRRAFVYAENATNIVIRGTGTLDGRGYAFREEGEDMSGESQPQTLPKLMCFNRCRDVRLEDFTYRRGGAWGCHLRNSDGVTMRRVKCFNHVNLTNDGIDIESRNVLIEDCDIDADDDAIAIKAESDKSFAVTNIVIRNCRLASMAYPFKIGTGSYADIRDVVVEDCTFPRTRMNHRFAWSKLVVGITNDISGICGIGIQCVDGGRLENVTVRNVEIEGYGVPLSIRLGRRHGPPGGKTTCLKNILVENIDAVAEGLTASSIVGSNGLEVENVTLRNFRVRLPGGATVSDVAHVYPNEKGYPGPNMFHSILPASGLFVQDARGVVLDGVDFSLARHDERPFTVLPSSALPAPTPRRQGALWTDTDGYPINAHGGGILHHEGTYYWYGEHKVYGNAGNWAHVGVHVYSSVNLCDWKDEGVAFSVDEDPGSPVGDGCIIERPKVVFCRKTAKFVMYFHLEKHERRARLAAAGVAISDSPSGPFSLVKVERPEGADCRDMNLFVDDDGSCWHVFSSESNNTAHIVRLSDDFLSYAGPSHRIFVGDRSEAMALFKRDGVYWCICSGCTGWAPNEARYYRAESLAGPWKRMGNPCTGVNPMNGFGPEKTWGGQSTAVFRVEGTDRFVAMFDIWNPKNQLDSRYVWQEIVFTENGIEIPWSSEWRATGRNGER